MLFARRRLPALLPQLPCSWETGTLLLGTLFILTCVVAVILGYFGNLDDVCNGYPTNSTSVCPLNQPHEPRRCALGAEVWPNIPVGTFYFPTALTPQCDFMMTTGALAILHCLVLILAAGGCRIRNRNFFRTSYQVGQMLTVMTALFAFIHVVSTSVATSGYGILCRSFERPRCRNRLEYNPMTAKCNPMARQLVPCSALGFSSFVGKVYLALVFSWIACALLVLIFALSAYYLVAMQREMAIKEAQRSGALNNDGMSQSGTSSTLVLSKSANRPPPHYEGTTRMAESDISSAARRVEAKYQLPGTTQYPDQLSYQPVIKPTQRPITMHGTVSGSTEI